MILAHEGCILNIFEGHRPRFGGCFCFSDNKNSNAILSDFTGRSKDCGRTRGLSQPSRGEVYVMDGDSIYLVAATTFLIKALIN